MIIARTVAEMKAARIRLPEPVGFVPTMGFLHQGHLSLVRRARTENQSVIVSIFVNPTQFGPNEDYTDYPRDTERDLQRLRDESVDAVFLPEPAEMYLPGAGTWVVLEGITDRLEGASRPGHFRGVTTIVAKLFHITEPTNAYFGQKDAQQALVIRKMVADLNMAPNVVVCPTWREPDGLAMSSRNVYLDPGERQSALTLWKALERARGLWTDGERDAARIRRAMMELIQQEPAARIDYISIADTETLAEVDTLENPALVSLAVWIGRTRLIDNIMLGVTD